MQHLRLARRRIGRQESLHELPRHGQKLKKVVTEVEIPPGFERQMRVRITGQGEPRPYGGHLAIAYCFISVLAHPLFERDGQHLVCRIPITYAQAALAPTIEVRRSKAVANESPPARSRAPCSAWAAKGCPTHVAAGWGTCWCKSYRSAQEIIQEEKSLLRDLAELEHKHVAAERKASSKTQEYFTAEEDARK